MTRRDKSSQCQLTELPLPTYTEPEPEKFSQPVTKKVDYRQLTMEGFRSLGLIAIFFASLQAQLLTVTLLDNSTIAARLINAFWLAGIILDIFGAVFATLTARWFEVLKPEDIEFLTEGWNADEKDLPPRSPWWKPPNSIVSWVIANALFSGPGIVACGVGMFLLGLLIYVWDKQPLIVSIISTTPFVALVPLVAAYFYPRPLDHKEIISVLAGKRGRW